MLVDVNPVMIKSLLLILFFATALSGCKKQTNAESGGNWFYVEVRSSSNLDCRVPEIIFLDRQHEAYQIIGDNAGVYNATGLPKVLYPVGTRMYVSIQKPNNSQLLACTARGPYFPQVYINEIK